MEERKLFLTLHSPYKTGIRFGLGFMTAWFTVELLFRFVDKILDLIMLGGGGI